MMKLLNSHLILSFKGPVQEKVVLKKKCLWRVKEMCLSWIFVKENSLWSSKQSTIITSYQLKHRTATKSSKCFCWPISDFFTVWCMCGVLITHLSCVIACTSDFQHVGSWKHQANKCCCFDCIFWTSVKEHVWK
jgi:hypothetical protein